MGMIRILFLIIPLIVSCDQVKYITRKVYFPIDQKRTISIKGFQTKKKIKHSINNIDVYYSANGLVVYYDSIDYNNNIIDSVRERLNHKDTIDLVWNNMFLIKQLNKGLVKIYNKKNKIYENTIIKTYSKDKNDCKRWVYKTKGGISFAFYYRIPCDFK